ncbi:MAG TPA: CaiB/BaiF CoA-transferase family protein [Dehalococcoidia bacterium]|jgi:crotonobetainyl-CoA:carnitine CoA-transferase CaiB-like acyl-CoA transferase|nr:CaiB/BaiF CoA-transferase family protein [Dehalococcoidia bacterium]
MLPLEGIKILDLSRLAPGPFCSMLLGDMGADVLLIEAPEGGKLAPAIAGARNQDLEKAAAFNTMSRNKRSMVLNLREPDAREIFYKLADDADVVLEGFRPGVVKRLGVDYETLHARNERIVYCSLSGFGQTGPYSQLVGHDINYISVAGALGMIGWPDTPPAIPMNIIADFAGGGLHAAFGILVALMARERSGKGQYVDIAMSDGVMYLLASLTGSVFAGGASPTRGGTILNGSVPHYNVYECADGGWISIGSLEPHFFVNLCKALGREDFIPHQWDSSKREEMAEFFRTQFKTKPRDEWFAILSQSDICAGPVYSLEEALNDPHNRARNMVVEVDHPTLGKVKQLGIGTKLSETPGAVRSTAPLAGQHTDDVLQSLGYDEAAVSALRERGVVQ